MTSKIKVDNINKVSDDSNIINKCGTNITMGQNGDTVILPNGVTEQVQSGGAIQVQSGGSITIASGATITNNGTAVGLGRTGTVDWATTPVTATFTAANGVGYFCNTSGGAFTVNLPAGSAGAIVSLADYAATWQTNAVTVSPNGTDKIGSVNANATLSTEGQSVTFVFVDSTQGWINTMDSTSNVRGSNPQFVTATGGTILTSTCGNFKSHIFTGPGTFCVSNAGNVCGSTTVDYLVVAGAGSAGGYYGAGGAGGFRASNGYCTPTMSPLASPTSLPVAATGYPVTVGAGGTANPSAPGIGGYDGNNGSNSVFAGTTTITSAGGGFGAASGPTVVGGSGGSGGSSGYFRPACGQGQGNTPPVSPSQGNPGGRASYANAGGGGGAGAAGADGTIGGVWSVSPIPGPNVGGPGGIGSYISDATLGPTAPSYGTPGPVGSTRYFAGGGGGGVCAPSSTGGTGGAGGGANGQDNGGPFGTPQNGTVNTGGGGSASGGGIGGSGIVIIRYKFQ